MTRGPKPLPHEAPRPRGLPRTNTPESRTSSGAEYVPDYGPSTRAKQAAASRWIARDIAERRRRPGPIQYVKGNWYDRDKLIGTSKGEDSPISRVTPRRLGNPRNR